MVNKNKNTKYLLRKNKNTKYLLRKLGAAEFYWEGLFRFESHSNDVPEEYKFQESVVPWVLGDELMDNDDGFKTDLIDDAVDFADGDYTLSGYKKLLSNALVVLSRTSKCWREEEMKKAILAEELYVATKQLNLFRNFEESEEECSDKLSHYDDKIIARLKQEMKDFDEVYFDD